MRTLAWLALALTPLAGGCRGPVSEAEKGAPAEAAPKPVAPTAVALAADGTLWLGGIDGQIRAERASGQAEDHGTLHDGTVRRFLFENEKLRWSVGADTVARIDAAGRVEARYRLPNRHLNDARVLPDGDVLVAAERGDVARLGPDGAVRWQARGHHGRAAFAVDVRPPAAGSTTPEEAVSVGADGRVSRWRLSDGEPLGEARGDDGALLRVLWLGEHLFTLSANGRLTRWSAELRPEVQRDTAVARPDGKAESQDLRLAGPATTGLLADFERLYVATRGGHVRSYRLPDLSAGPVFSPPAPPAVFAPEASKPTAVVSATDPTIQAFDLRDDTLVVVHADGRIQRHTVPRRRLTTVRRLPPDAVPAPVDTAPEPKPETPMP